MTLPSLLNIALSTLLAFKLGKHLRTQIPLMVGFSALFALTFRIPSLITGDPNETRVEITKRTVIGPRAKILLDIEEEYVYFRRKTDPPSVGLRNDWSLGALPLDTIYEKPESILSELGIAHTRTGSEVTVLRIRTDVRDGVMVVTAVVLEASKPVATYIHRTRKSYPLEEFDYQGRFKDGDWRPIFLYLTQNVFWAPRKDLFPADSRPLKAFLQAALVQGGVTDSGAPVTPVVDALNSPSMLQNTSAKFHLETRVDGTKIPRNKIVCDGEDAGERYTATVAEVRWNDPQIPSLHVPRSVIDGYLALPDAILCDVETNSFWLADYHMGRVHLWKYRVDFNARSLRLVQWLQAEPPPEAKESFEAMRRQTIWISAVRGESAELYMVSRRDMTDLFTAEYGYRIDVNLMR